MTDIRDFVGKVQVKFSDAVIAATSSARTAETTEGVRYLIPIRDIYMEFFDRSDERAQTPMGPGSLWNVSAVGEAADNVLVLFETAEDAPQLVGYGFFQSDAVDVHIEEKPDPAHDPRFNR
jgi:uncharacterized protein (DUF427 family)